MFSFDKALVSIDLNIIQQLLDMQACCARKYTLKQHKNGLWTRVQFPPAPPYAKPQLV
jgi:hypothetical protein